MNSEEKLKASLFKRVSKLIHIVSWLLVGFFGWLSFKDFPYSVFLNTEYAAILMKFTLTLYFTSWIFGVGMDLEDEELTFIIAPQKGQFKRLAACTIVTIAGLFAFLCVIKSYKILSLFFLVFLLLDKCSHIYLINYVKETFAKSKTAYIKENNFIGFQKLRAVEEFLLGKYYNRRFFTAVVLLIIINIVAFSNLNLVFAEIINVNTPDVVIAILLFLYLLTIELWIWYKRISRKVKIDILNEIEENFRLEKVSDNEENKD